MVICEMEMLKLPKDSVVQFLRKRESGLYQNRPAIKLFPRNAVDYGELIDRSTDQLIIQLEELVDHGIDEKYRIDVLKGILTKLTNYDTRRIHDETEEEQNQWTETFVAYNGVQALVRILLYWNYLPPTGYVKYGETAEELRVKALVLEILSAIITTRVGEKVASSLCDDGELMMVCFLSLRYDQTYLPATQLIEDLLQQRARVYDLRTLKAEGLEHLFTSLDDTKLANCCRLLAVTISDMDVYENKSSLFEQNRQRRATGFVNIRDTNQDLLMSFPRLLSRLVEIACKQPLVPRPSNESSELDNWMEFIDTSIAEQSYDTPTVDDIETFMGGISTMHTEMGPLIRQPSLEVSFQLLQRVDVIYTLGLFLVGKHRKKVQRKLAEMKLIPGMSVLFDQFIWKCQSKMRLRLRGHNPLCECSPEVAMKIQFLRLVHSFCDHSDYKHLLLTKCELQEIKDINNNAEMLKDPTLNNINKSLMCQGRQGLLSKIVDVMKKEPTASTFRFWLARAVESYLRGSTLYCDQIFLVRRGILAHVACNILEYERRPKEILQSSFDLLGEVVKFNYDAFKVFDQLLTQNERFNTFVDIIGKNLVDSNMFLRSLILTCNHFTTQQVDYGHYATEECRLLSYVSKFEQQVVYLYKLIAGINVTSLTQENVSCLNTTLVLLMFARKRGELVRYLQALRDWPRPLTSRDSGISACQMMTNFRDLLFFWQEHYLHKDKDCSALEKSSRIPFDYWKETVSVLVSDDRDTCVSLNHYISAGELRTC